MSLIGQKTKSDYIEWEKLQALSQKLDFVAELIDPSKKTDPHRVWATGLQDVYQN
jgi:hypothetical protein